MIEGKRRIREFVEKEFDSFFEFDTENKIYVTSVSCKLFAERIAEIFDDIAHDLAGCIYRLDKYRLISENLTDDEASHRDHLLSVGLDAMERYRKLTGKNNA